MKSGDQLPGVEKMEATTRHRPAGATPTGDGEPLPGAEKKEATTRQRPAGATSTGDGEPLPGAVKKKEATTRQRPPGATSAGDGAEDEESRPQDGQGGTSQEVWIDWQSIPIWKLLLYQKRR